MILILRIPGYSCPFVAKNDILKDQNHKKIL
jgi:hypothetical protein